MLDQKLFFNNYPHLLRLKDHYTGLFYCAKSTALVWDFNKKLSHRKPQQRSCSVHLARKCILESFVICKNTLEGHALNKDHQQWHAWFRFLTLYRSKYIQFLRKFKVMATAIYLSPNYLNIPNFLLIWFSSYLSNHQQRVRVKNSVSTFRKLNGGMPRGSWLGPLAFLVLIDDFSIGCPLHKYVDDTTLSELVQPKQPDTHMCTY